MRSKHWQKHWQELFHIGKYSTRLGRNSIPAWQQGLLQAWQPTNAELVCRHPVTTCITISYWHLPPIPAPSSLLVRDAPDTFISTLLQSSSCGGLSDHKRLQVVLQTCLISPAHASHNILNPQPLVLHYRNPSQLQMPALISYPNCSSRLAHPLPDSPICSHLDFHLLL